MKGVLKIATMLAFGLIWLASGSFAANQNRHKDLPVRSHIDSQDRAQLKWEKFDGAEEVPQIDSDSNKEQFQPRKSLGFYLSNATQVGTTYYDIQSNGTQQREIAVGCGGRIHSIWTFLPGPSSANRVTKFVSYIPGDSLPVPVTMSAVGGGYPAAAVDGLGVGIAAWHVAANGTYTTRDSACGATRFNSFLMPPPPNCSNTITGSAGFEGKYIWPYIAGDTDASGNPIVHVVATESPVESGTGTIQSVVYYRSNAGITAPSGTCGKFIDSVYDISACVAADPNSQRVAIAYCKPKEYMANGSQRNNDIVYVESTDLGATWGERVNVTNYTDSDLERAYCEVSALYTSDGCLHILWNAPGYDPASGGGYIQCKLYHWESCSRCKTLLINADNRQTCGMTSWHRNVAKVSLSECAVDGVRRLYAVYTYYRGDDDGVASGDPGPIDCSANGWANGEIYTQVSETGGLSWGPPVNLTNTYSNDCPGGDCFSESWSSSATYVNDSLRIQYILDKDAGRITGTEGTWTNNPVINLSYPCFAMAAYRSLAVTPTTIIDVFVDAAGSQKDTALVLTNLGNVATAYNRSVYYGGSSGWLSFPNDPDTSGTVPVGCVSDTIPMRIIVPPPSYLPYFAIVRFIYEGTDGNPDTLAVTIFVSNLPYNSETNMRTSTNRLRVGGNSRTAHQENGSKFTYFADQSDYLYDGSLIVGNAVDNLSWLIYEGEDRGPTPSNPFGHLYALSHLTVDSTSNDSYCYATGIGTNRDSTLGFTTEWFAPKHIDSADFYIGYFKIYKGVNNPTGVVTDLTVAYAADWDVPADSAFRNTGGFDEDLQLVYQRGFGTPTNLNRYGGIAAVRDDIQPIPAGFVWTNAYSVYPVSGFENDTVWKAISTVGGYQIPSTTEDMNSILVVGRNETINGALNDTLGFAIIFAGQQNGSVANLKSVVVKARRFLCDHVAASSFFCSCPYGDADGNGIVNISDVVFLISFIFSGGPSPTPSCQGDADRNGFTNVSDAVYLINCIFAGGPCPF